MNKYCRLNLSEREEISRGLAQNQSYREIAGHLKRNISTISREINQKELNRKTYRANDAHKRAERLAKKHHLQQKIINNPFLQEYIHQKLHLHWSPEQIAKRLKILYPTDMAMQISYESIYSYLYIQSRGALHKELVKCLRRRHLNRRLRNKTRQKCCPIQDYISIEERPAEVADRIVPGHWEGDLLMGCNNSSALGSLVERTTRMTFLVKLKAKDATTVRKTFAREFKHLPEGLKYSLTYDHGQEMAEHKLFTKSTRIKVYFAHPHSPWERGTSENTNDLIRQFFPKGTDFSKISLRRIKRVQEMLNDRPRKILKFLTPHEVFSKLLR